MTELENIAGIGKVSADKLLKHFRSVKNVQNAPEEALLAVLSLKQAQSLQTYFKNQKGSS